MKAMSKRERIEFLLEHWTDFFDPDGTMSERGAVSGSEGGIPLLPKMSRQRSVVELGRALGEVHARWPNHFKHLNAFYLAPWRTTRQPKVKSHKGRTVRLRADPSRDLDWDYKRVRIVPPWVSSRMVCLGVDGVTFVFVGEVYIPNELLEAAA